MNKEIKMNFDKPTTVSNLDTIFGGDVRKLMPLYRDIPEDFKKQRNPYVKFQQKWFFEGIKMEDRPKSKEGIDEVIAWEHLKAIQMSYEPKHEHKEAGVAYLMSLWFEEPKIKEKI